MKQTKFHIQKNTVQETLVIPLYARKLCTELYPNLFEDHRAVELMGRLDYDFSQIEKKSKSLMQRFGALEVAMRQTDLAAEVRDYLDSHPAAAVVNLGCGLDQTGESCDNGTCRIYNVDLPPVIELRSRLLPGSDRVKNIAADLNDPAWMDEIDAADGAVFFAAGVFYYFTKPQVQTLFNTLSRKFPGGRLVFDTAGARAVHMMVKTWIKEAGISSVDAMFHVDDLQKDLAVWMPYAEVSAKGYMLGYRDLRQYGVKGLFLTLAKLGDGMMKMKIARQDFKK